MRKCKCGNAVANNSKFCPHCGHRFTSGFTKFVGLMVVVFGFLVLMIMIAASNSESTSDGPGTTQASHQQPAYSPAKPKTPTQIATEQVAARKAYAALIDQQLLDLGIESKTFTQGAQAKTVVIQDALAGRVRMNALSKNSKMFEQLKALGFTHLRYTNNFESDLNETYDWNLTKD